MKNIRRIGIYLIIISLVVLSIVGCSNEKPTEEVVPIKDGTSEETSSNYPIEISDEFGNTVSFEKEPMRIISLAPSNTEILFALDLDDKIIGVTSYCDYPEEALEKQVIGSYGEFNLEKIIELEPDLILTYGEGDKDENEILRDAGINILGFMPETIDEVIEDMKKIGKITGKDEKALDLTNKMIDEKNQIIDKVKNEEKKKVFYEVWHEPLQAAGKDSFIGELITLAGGENIAVGEEGQDIGAYPMFDLEKLIESNPEIYLTSADLPEKTIGSIKERAGYENIDAIKNDRVYIYEGNKANILSRPGPRIIEALEILAKTIHPELYN